MGVDVEMEVQCLPPKDALKLFKKKVGEITLSSDPNIPDLAEIVAKECRGLPLALNVIGEVMARKRKIQEWRHAINVFKKYAAEFSGMDDKILPILKYSYNNIEEDRVKSCFLYCALFPEDHEIHIETLIHYWIGEGVIDESEGIERAEDEGYDIIGNLVRASLLMESGLDHLRMHDVVRDMALWIASDLGKEKEAYTVRTGEGLSEVPKVKNWKVVKRMSLMNNNIVHIAGSNPECFELTTFLMQHNLLENISSEFFKSMSKLAVMDLSGNKKLSELADGISKLVSLRYLNLFQTYERRLPLRLLENSKNLIHLVLPLFITSISGISKLQNLKVLELNFPLDLVDNFDELEELEALEYLQVLSIGFQNPLPLEKFLSSHKLTSCTRKLRMSNMNLESSGIALPITMDKLRDIKVFRCGISEIKMVKICNKSKTVTLLHNPSNICFSSLSVVSLYICKCLKELTFLMFAPNLKELMIESGVDLEDIINKEKASGGGEESGIVPIFGNLNRLKLFGLPKLKNIYWSPLPFPCLKEIRVKDCPNLKKLPLNSQSGKHGEDGLSIYYGRRKWIKGVEWEDAATKTRFLSSCQKETKLL